MRSVSSISPPARHPHPKKKTHTHTCLWSTVCLSSPTSLKHYRWFYLQNSPSIKSRHMDASILHSDSLSLTRLCVTTTTASAVSLTHQMPCLLFSTPGRKLVSLSSISWPRRSPSFIAAASSGTLMANSVTRFLNPCSLCLINFFYLIC